MYLLLVQAWRIGLGSIALVSHPGEFGRLSPPAGSEMEIVSKVSDSASLLAVVVPDERGPCLSVCVCKCENSGEY